MQGFLFQLAALQRSPVVEWKKTGGQILISNIKFIKLP